MLKAGLSSYDGIMKWWMIGIILISLSATLGRADDRPIVGRRAAQKYFTHRTVASQSEEQASTQKAVEVKNNPSEPVNISSPTSRGDHYLALHAGMFVDSHAWAWGHNGTPDNIGKTNFGVTYRFGDGGQTMDWVIRTEFTSYSLPEGDAFKISFVPMLLFPEAESRFPLYFGAGLGPGIFAKQTPDSSPLSLDYELVAGVRFFNLWRSTGFFAETGLKNHFHLIGAGQFNGVFISVGALFSF